MPSPTSSIWDDFVALPENRSALRAVKRVVSAIQTSRHLPFDVLTLHGPPGSGKSHLVATAVKAIPGAVMMPAIDIKRFHGQDLRYVNLLIVEGVHTYKPIPLKKFIALLETRAAHRKYTIVTSAVPPTEMTTQPQRFTSLLAGGLVVHLGPLSSASRVRLVCRFAKERNVELPTRVVAMIAEKIPGGIRPMAGAVEEWIAAKKMGVKFVLPSVAIKEVPDHPLAGIVKKVSRVFGISVEEIRGKSQLNSVVTARQVAIVLGHRQFKISNPVIGQYLNRASTSCSNSEVNLRWKMIRNVELNAKVNGLIDECRELRRSQLLEEEFLIEKKPRKERRRKLVAHTWREDDASLRDDDRTVDTTGELIWNNQSAPP